MDFHTLSRRELQTLCKKNKIPANMTNVAMADALAALSNVEGIEEIGQASENGVLQPQTPATSRRTTARKTLPKPSGVIEIPETPATRTGRKRVTGTSVCRKLDTQTNEEDVKGEVIPVVTHGYSTRRSSRLQSAKNNVSESVQKRGGRRNEALKIADMSEEETENSEKKSNSDDTQESKGTDVKVLEPIPDVEQNLALEDDSASMVTEDVSAIALPAVSEETLSSESQVELTAQFSTVDQVMSSEISSNVSAPVLEPSASEDVLSLEVKDECMEEVNVDQVMSSEISANVSATIVESSASEDVPSSESKDESMEDLKNDQDMSIVDSSATSEEQHQSEIVEDVAVENSSAKKDIAVDDSSAPVTFATEDSSLIIVHVPEVAAEAHTAEDSNGDYAMNLLPSNQDADINNGVQVMATNDQDSSVEKSLTDVISSEVSMKNADDDSDGESWTSSLPSDLGSLPSDLDEVLNNGDMVLESNEHSSPKADAWDFSGFKGKVQEYLDSLEKEKATQVAESVDANEREPKRVEQEDQFLDDMKEENQMVACPNASFEVPDGEVDAPIVESTIQKQATPVKSEAGFVQNKTQATPLRSSTAKKATPASKRMIKVLDESLVSDDNKISLSNAGINNNLTSDPELLPVVSVEKENSITEKSSETAKKEMKTLSIRKLRKMLQEMQMKDDKNTVSKEELQVEKKRTALQTVDENCSVVSEKN